MTDLNKQELRRLAEASAENESWYELADFHAGRVTALELDVVSEADRNFIVSASPATILSLLDELDGQAQQFKEWQASHHANYCAVAEERDQHRAEIEACRRQIKALIHISDATQWEQHTCGEIAKARALLAGEGNANG